MKIKKKKPKPTQLSALSSYLVFFTLCGTEALQHVEKNCRVKVEGETTKVKRSLFSWYHPNDGRPSRDTMFQRARRNALSEEKKQQVREKDNEQHRTAYHQLGDDGKEALAEKKADYRTGYSEEKKQYVLEKDADQHRTARTGYSEPKKQDVREKDAEVPGFLTERPSSATAGSRGR